MEEKQLKEKIRHLQLANMCLDENNKYYQQKINEVLEYIDSILTFNECEINDIKVIKQILKGDEK